MGTTQCFPGSHYYLPNVIRPLMISGDFFMSLIAAIGSPQLATGPQKCYNKEIVQQMKFISLIC